MTEHNHGIKLPYLLNDGMVLQREETVRIWGWASPGKQLTVEFLNQSYPTEVKEDGSWEILMQNLHAGGPFKMELRCADEIRILSDILVGDVWVLGGQSNMELNVSRTLDLYEEEVRRDSDYSYIRRFHVPQTYDFHHPREELAAGEWIRISPDTAKEFSAVGYFFAKEIYNLYRIPIGLIEAAVGGTPAQAWMSGQSLEHFDRYRETLSRCQDDDYVEETVAQDELQSNSWYARIKEEDAGLREGELPWYHPDLQEEGWSGLEIPCSFCGIELEKHKGSVWFRKEIIVPEEMAGLEARLVLGTIVDADDTYLNGVRIGSTGYQYPPRRYPIPEGLLKAGKNLIAVRVIITRNTGAFITDMPYYIKAGENRLPLSGIWHYRIGTKMPALEPGIFFKYMPTGLFNGMIYPLRKYRVRGVLWYQGESNTEYPYDYKALFEAVIRDWRSVWGKEALPFYYVQLANYCPWRKEPEESGWAMLREEQRQALQIPATGMAVTIDIGEYNDLHPKDKKTVGQRLARWVRRDFFGEELEVSGPLFRHAEQEGERLRLSFDHTVGGLAARGEELRGFVLCGRDGKYYPAIAAIDGAEVLVYQEAVPQPTGVRYAWMDNPEEANLYNAQGLPASPFQAEL
jgi:sialate O-acetylesterase